MVQHELRKRKKQSKGSSKKQVEENKTNEIAQAHQAEAKEPTMWDTFVSHPLVRILPIVLIPYCLYQSFFFLRLQHPEYLNGIVNLRPAVGLTEERQVLIVGSMSSGTVQVTADLYDNFKVEVAHEASDASWYFVRDGTVSWFHGIRFLPRPDQQNIARMCLNYTGNMGFHPSMYRSTSQCNPRNKWDRCWAQECFKLLDQEWGCGLVEGDFEQTCETPFRKTLHQLRHPLRTVESLVTKFCVGGVEGDLHPSFLKFMPHLFPSLTPLEDTCIEAAVKYVLEYTRSMLEARNKGHIAAMYKIEEATPCGIAELAGLASPDAIYAPNYEKINNICSQPFHPARETIKSTKHQVNQGQVTLEWSDLRGGMHGSKRTDDDLAEALKALTVELGYNPDKQETTEGEFH
jgi:hypothetical protein